MSSFEERAAARAVWPVRIVPLSEEGRTDLRDTSTVDERLAMVAVLTRQLWKFAGRQAPTYSRHDMPGRACRRGDGT